MKTSVLTLFCAAHVALAGVASVNKRCNSDDKSCNQVQNQHYSPEGKSDKPYGSKCQAGEKWCNEQYNKPSCNTGDNWCNEQYNKPGYHNDKCFEQVARRGEQARADCLKFFQKATMTSEKELMATAFVTSTVFVTRESSFFATVGFNKRAEAAGIEARDPQNPQFAPDTTVNLPDYTTSPTSSSTSSTSSTTSTSDSSSSSSSSTTPIIPPVTKRGVYNKFGDWDDEYDDYRPMPTGVPRYASGCTRAGMYASACYKYGVDSEYATPTITAKPTSTVVVTSTIVASTTTAVCDPINNFGYLFRGGFLTNGLDQRGLSVDFAEYGGTDLRSCCSRCFTTRGCLIWTIINGFCRLYVETSGISPDTTGICPFGLARVFSYIDRPDRARYGIGFCGKYIGPPP